MKQYVKKYGIRIGIIVLAAVLLILVTSAARGGRISLLHKNVPGMISQVTKVLGAEGVNIADMTNKSKGEYAYTMIDLESAASGKALDELEGIDGMFRVRVVK